MFRCLCLCCSHFCCHLSCSTVYLFIYFSPRARSSLVLLNCHLSGCWISLKTFKVSFVLFLRLICSCYILEKRDGPGTSNREPWVPKSLLRHYGGLVCFSAPSDSALNIIPPYNFPHRFWGQGCQWLIPPSDSHFFPIGFQESQDISSFWYLPSYLYFKVFWQ